ncbi:MAG: acyl carrier protein [Lentisphaerae bacterium]|nr:MAG: acyl carrier protein [Lentisphaerota bacterium]
MSVEEIRRAFYNLLIDEFEFSEDELKGDARLREDLELDSLDYVDLIAVLQRDFGIRLRGDERLKQVKTLDDVVNLIAQLLAEKKEGS